jgi:hypothetical protein
MWNIAFIISFIIVSLQMCWAKPGAVAKKNKRRLSHVGVKVQSSHCRDIFCTSQQIIRLDKSTADDPSLSEEEVEEVFKRHRQKLEPCLIQARRRDPHATQARIEMVVTGKGKILASRVDGKQASLLARCIHKKLITIRFPRFAQKRAVASITVAMPD